MQQIIQAIHNVFSVSPRAEATLECAPGQLSDELLDSLTDFGFNRVSLGVQSFIDRELKAVGRLHTSALALKEIERVRAAGIDNINVDLIAGLPHQTIGSWRESLQMAIQTAVQHVSVYMLDVDEDSRLGREMLAGGTRYGVGLVPNDDSIAAMYTEACEMLEASGINQYEISNFARPGRESTHNLKYWLRDPIIGFGLDAHSFLNTSDGGQIRIATTDDLSEYLEHGTQSSVTDLSITEQIEEAWFLGLRLSAGISLKKMTRKIGASAMQAYEPIVRSCEQDRLLERCSDNVRLTHPGRLFANEVFARFLQVLDPVEKAEGEGACA